MFFVKCNVAYNMIETKNYHFQYNKYCRATMYQVKSINNNKKSHFCESFLTTKQNSIMNCARIMRNNTLNHTLHFLINI